MRAEIWSLISPARAEAVWGEKQNPWVKREGSLKQGKSESGGYVSPSDDGTRPLRGHLKSPVELKCSPGRESGGLCLLLITVPTERTGEFFRQTNRLTLLKGGRAAGLGTKPPML